MLSRGDPLSRILQGRALSPERATGLGILIARRLADDHKRGRLLRDLKPSDIFVLPDGGIRIDNVAMANLSEHLDSTMGLGEIARAKTGGLSDATPGAGVVIGALPYMSPEQLRGEPVDARSNIFSFGVVFYEMLTGRRPFVGRTSGELQQEILSGRAISALDIGSSAPKTLTNLVLKTLGPERSDRFQSMDELAEALTAVELELKVEPPKVSKKKSEPLPSSVASPAKPSRMLIWAVGLIALVSIVYMIGQRRIPPADPNTVLVLPMEVRGQSEGADYVGRAFAEAIAIALTQGNNVHVLPIPQASEFADIDAMKRVEKARRMGAGRLITGAITRETDQLTGSLSLLDTEQNRILWGTSKKTANSDLSHLATDLARDAGIQLGAKFPRLYDEITNLAGEAEMASSPLSGEAIAALRQGDIKAAVSATARLVQRFDTDFDAHALRAHALFLKWDADPSPAHRQAFNASVKRLKKIDPSNPYSVFYEAYEMWADRKPDAAVSQFSSILQRTDLTPSARAWVLRYRAVAKRSMKDYASALVDLEQSVKSDPANARTLSILSELLQRMKRTEEALTRAKQAAAMKPSYWRNHQTLGLVFYDLKRWEEAERAYAKACELGQAQVPCALQALCLEHLGKREEARKVVEATEKLTATRWGTYNLACYWAIVGNPKRSLQLLQRAVDLGWADELVHSDQDLASVRKLPDFAALAAEVDRRLKATKD